MQKSNNFHHSQKTTSPVNLSPQDSNRFQSILKGKTIMFWLVSIFIGLAAVFVKLGAYSVWISIFKALFSFIVVASGIGLAIFLVRKMLR
jgi:hypothetical protein